MPYEELPVIPTPDRSQKIWRYMGFTKLCWVLQESQLHFHRVGDFEDHFEGSLPVSMQEMLYSGLEDMIEDVDSWETNGEFNEFATHMIESLERKEKTSTFANCWHANGGESAALWDQYRQSGQPVAIVSRVGRLIDALSSTSDTVYIGEVAYVDHYSSASEVGEQTRNEVRKLVGEEESMSGFYNTLTKRKEFKHENEVRAIISKTPDQLDDSEEEPTTIGEYNNLEPPYTNYHNIQVNPSELIEKIVVAPDTPDWFYKTLKTFVSESKTDLEGDDVLPSRMDQTPQTILSED